MPRPDEDDEEEVGEARLTSACREGTGVLSKSVEVAGVAEEEGSTEEEADAEDADTDDADGTADVFGGDSTMVDAEDAGSAAVTVTSCVLTTVAVDTDTLTDAAASLAADADTDAGVAPDDAGAVVLAADIDEAADVPPEAAKLELELEEEVPEVAVIGPPPPPSPPPPLPPAPALADDTGAGVPTTAIGSPLGALGVAVGCTPAKFATGTVPLTVGAGRPPGYESSKMSSCAPFRKLYRFV